MRARVRWSSAILCGLLMVSLAACNMPTQSLASDSSLASATSALSVPGQGEPDASGADSSELEFEPIDLSEELADCTSFYTLGIQADATLEVMDMSLTHKVSGAFLMLYAEGPVTKGRQIPVHSAVDGEEFPYTLTGTLNGCTVQGEGKMTASAMGWCQNGVVALEIIETWGPGNGTITCTGEDTSQGTAPFTVPGLGRMLHNGEDGSGERFLLRTSEVGDSGEGITGGSRVSRPFGMGGGSHTWVLSATR